MKCSRLLLNPEKNRFSVERDPLTNWPAPYRNDPVSVCGISLKPSDEPRDNGVVVETDVNDAPCRKDGW